MRGWPRVEYRYDHDPAVLAADALQRTFAGTLHSDGTATFQDVTARALYTGSQIVRSGKATAATQYGQ